MSGHRSSRRRDYGRRQKDVRDRRSTDLEVDLEGPAGWSRTASWAGAGDTALRPVAPVRRSLDGAGA